MSATKRRSSIGSAGRWPIAGGAGTKTFTEYREFATVLTWLSDSGSSKCRRARRGRNLAARHSREHPVAAAFAAIRSARRPAIRRASRLHVGDGAAGLAGPAVLVAAGSGNGAARGHDRHAVRADARMRAPHRLCLAHCQRSRWLGRRRAELLQFDLFSSFPRLASPLYAGPGPRSRS